MKKFTQSELKSILVIFGVLFFVTSINISASLRKGRDATRKNDMSAIQKEIDTYYQKYRVLPLSNNEGKIVGCFTETPNLDVATGMPLNVEVCEWGKSTFENMNTMVMDPNAKSGSSYLYKSDGSSYELYVALEGKSEAEYQLATASKNLHCGTEICNYGREVK
jgi:type II secretory pathway pseudopilin PulG